MTTLTAYIEYDANAHMDVGLIPGQPGPPAQAATRDEFQANLREVVSLGLEENAQVLAQMPRFVGVHQMEVV